MKPKLIVATALATVTATIMLALATPPAPPVVRFSTLAGESFHLSELRGKVVLVNFWATYCGTCMQEMPKMIETHRRLAPRGLETVAVAVRHDDRARVAQYAKNLPFKVVYDARGEAAREFGNVRITPTSFLIDRQGNVLKRFVGEPDWAEVERSL
jgi:thiol-disulfide isomerase/thioredoxin